jgi:hypothetical protein
MTSRRVAALSLAVLLCVAPVAGAHVPGANHSTPGHEAALAVTAALASLVYFPAKVAMASVGLVSGGLTGLVTGGDTRAEYAVLVPLVGGDYVVRPAHVDGVRPFEVFGTHYDDEPSQRGSDRSIIYDSLYGQDESTDGGATQ